LLIAELETGDLRIENGPGGAELVVRVVPRAGRDAVAGVRDGALLLRLAAAPVDGAANEALVRVLAETLGVPRRAVALVSGERSRRKRVRIAGLTAADAGHRLSAILTR
jgi:uncharacterized protein (TIGR00251 family)